MPHQGGGRRHSVGVRWTSVPWRDTCRRHPRDSLTFAGKTIFQRERWYHRLLHNETALAVETRLRWLGQTMVTLPIPSKRAGLSSG